MIKASFSKKEKVQFIITLILIPITIYLFYNANVNNFYFSRVGAPECFWHYWTGYYCPGCGGTRAFDCLLHFSWINSLLYHPVILTGFFMYIASIVGFLICFVKKNTKYIFHINIEKILYLDLLIVGFFFIRNLFLYLFLY